MIAQNLNGAEHRTTDAAGEAHDSIRSIANCRDAMQGALNAGAIVATEVADARDYPVQVFVGHLAVEQRYVA